MCKVTDSVSPSLSPCGRSKPVAMMEGKRRKVYIEEASNLEHFYEKDFTEDDKPFIWWSGDEQLTIKQNIYAMIRSLQECNEHGDNAGREYHWRGFEHIKSNQSRKTIRRQHCEELLFHQNAMRMKDPVDLGLLAISNSRDSSQRARQFGILDESEAFAIYNENENDAHDEDNIAPDAGSLAGSDQSDDEDLFAQTHSPLTVCTVEGDDKTVYLLPRLQPKSFEEENALSILDIPYKLVLILFPCIR